MCVQLRPRAIIVPIVLRLKSLFTTPLVEHELQIRYRPPQCCPYVPSEVEERGRPVGQRVPVTNGAGLGAHHASRVRVDRQHVRAGTEVRVAVAPHHVRHVAVEHNLLVRQHQARGQHTVFLEQLPRKSEPQLRRFQFVELLVRVAQRAGHLQPSVVVRERREVEIHGDGGR